MSSSRIVKVGLLSTYLRELIEGDDFLQDVWIEGEVSAYTVPGSGHAYFTIKDASTSVDCVMWKQTRQRQSFQARVGDLVVVHGSATVYEKNARFQIKSDVIYPAGAGILQLQLEQLKQRLDAEGLFDPTRKRPLPQFPRRIGVVTSPTGAVWLDIRNVLSRRYPLAELVLAPAVVQGDAAPDSVVHALAALQEEEIDVVIVARGGGSAEDLWTFNDERIARAIFASRVPVVSAIGHETDTSIADLVADLRAPTPSAAAEVVAPDLSDIAAWIVEITARSGRLVGGRFDAASRELTNLQHRLALASPKAQLVAMQSSLSAVSSRLAAATELTLERKAHRLDRAMAMMGALDPQTLLSRGYAHITHADSRATITSAAILNSGDRMVATFADGSVGASIEQVLLNPVTTQ